MDLNNDKAIIVEQYRIYSDAKEKFTERQFSTNRFYLVLNLIILTTTYILATLTPQYHPVIILSIIGGAATLMWWMSIDSYQILIKIKYADVLEYLETKLPEQPYHKEYVEYAAAKKKRKIIVFDDFQKFLVFAIGCVYLAALIYSVVNFLLIRFQIFPQF